MSLQSRGGYSARRTFPKVSYSRWIMTKDEFEKAMNAAQAEHDAAIDDRNECDKRRRAALKKMEDIKSEFIRAVMEPTKPKK